LLLLPPAAHELVDERQRLSDLRLCQQQLAREARPPRHEVLELEENLPALVRRQPPHHLERWIPAPTLVVIAPHAAAATMPTTATTNTAATTNAAAAAEFTTAIA
jgi:hypothetical protein